MALNSFPVSSENAKPNSDVRKVMAAAFQSPGALSTAPTSDNALQLLPRSGDNGYFGSDLYVNLGGSIIKFIGVLIV